MADKVAVDWLHTDRVEYPDSLEIGKAGTRLTVSFNIDDPIQARDRIDEGMALRDYAVNSLQISIDKELAAKAAKAAAMKK
jgi:hypothetical protein